MTDLLPRAPVTAAFVSVLETTDLAVGDGRVPKPQPDVDDVYYIVYELPSAYRNTDADGDLDGADLPYQVTAVGGRRDQVSQALDRARDVITTAALSAALHPDPDPQPHVRVDRCQSDGAGRAIPIPGSNGDLFNGHETYTATVFRSA